MQIAGGWGGLPIFRMGLPARYLRGWLYGAWFFLLNPDPADSAPARLETGNPGKKEWGR